MKHLRIIAAVMLLAVGMTAWAKRKADVDGKPDIKFEQTTHDFGTVNAATKWLEHDFTFTNPGTAPLAIATVSASCGCTKPEFSTKPVQPGKSGTVKLRFTPKGLPNGKFKRVARVRTNVQGKNKTVVLTITGKVTGSTKE